MIAYRLVRSERKTLALEITSDLEVLVRAPRRLDRDSIDSFVTTHLDWINTHKEKARIRKEKYPEPDENEIRELISKAKSYLPARTAYYAGLMGLKPQYIKITSAKRRFGSCSGKNGICFSWRLMRYPESAIDYVIVHELAHIEHKNHGGAFYDRIEAILPDFRERRKLLR
jgi:predicted metal-dependent hydrolase